MTRERINNSRVCLHAGDGEGWRQSGAGARRGRWVGGGGVMVFGPARLVKSHIDAIAEDIAQ